MWSNYFLTTYRTFIRNKFFVGVNLLSIAIAFALCTIAYFNIQFNQAFNTYFEDAESIVKVNTIKNTQEGTRIQSNSPIAIKEYLDADFPDLISSRYKAQSEVIKIEDNSFRELVAYADEAFFELFSFELQNDNLPRFRNQREVFISSDLALRYFGSTQIEDGVIKIQLENGDFKSFSVGGILKDVPKNTSFLFDLIIPFSNYEDQYQIDLRDWKHWTNATFISSKQYSPDLITEALNKYLGVQKTQSKSEEIVAYEVDNILNWPAYENSSLNSSFMGHLHPASVVGTVSAAIGVLILAIFNFINTSLAIARKRIKEIGMRKVFGGQKSDIRFQFLAESLLQLLFAMVLSGLISMLLIDPYNSMFEFEIVEFERVSFLPFLMFMTGVWLITGVLSGLYPAFYISKYESLKIIKGNLKLGNRSMFTRILLTFQLVVCVYNVFSMIVFNQNAAYQETLDRGYYADQSINIPIKSANQYQVLEAELQNVKGISGISGTMNTIGFSAPVEVINYKQHNYDVAALKVGLNYLENLGVRLNKGRLFQKGDLESENSIVINSLLAKTLEKDVLNEWIFLDGKRYQVIGIVDDFNLKPIMLDNKIQPTVLLPVGEEAYQVAHLAIEDDVLATEAQIKTIWSKLFPDQLYTGFLQEDVMKAIRETNNIMISISGVVAFLTLFISAIGLYSMVYLNIQSRMKEFGVRKVLGANVNQIMLMINRPVIIMLAIALILGLINGRIVIGIVLDIVYAYHRGIDPLNFVWPILVVTALISLSIGFKVYESARTNPVDQLRME